MRIVPTCLLLLLLLTLPALPAAAQERCVQNPPSVSAGIRERIAYLREVWAHNGSLHPDDVAELRSLEARADWGARVGAGNGWIADGPNSCVRHYDASGAPVLGTRVYLPGSSSPVTESLPSGVGQAARVISGPARIRSGPGLEHGRVRWCGVNWQLTVWSPAQGGWLRASCYGARGWIHQSLVSIGGAPAVTDGASAPVSLPAAGDAMQAVVIRGPAHIRSGPGVEHAHLRWCGVNWPLTVWSPAVDGWLRASCYGARGWIHQSLVSVDGAPAPVTVAAPAAAPAAVSPAAVSASVTGSGQQATVINGPAHIRSGPGQEHGHVRWCGVGWSLTVWTPAQGGWLPASCYGANGWIHESLISIGG